MELALSLGDSSKPFPALLKSGKMSGSTGDLGFCMGLALAGGSTTSSSNNNDDEEDEERRASSDPPPPLHQLDLLPASPVAVSVPVPVRHHQMRKQLQWLTPSMMAVSPTNSGSEGVGKGYEVLKRKSLVAVEEAEDDQSSPNSTSSSFQQHLDLSIYRKCFGGGGGNNNCSKRPWEYYHKDNTTRTGDGDGDEANNRGGGGGSDEEDNGLTRKKLRLSKDQSAFLEESFKEHNTLTPKQKVALAKELNLRPRQVEVWFQNRRARTKLKQTEVDCEYLKRCCETLTEENRRLQKELQELRALKSSQPFFMQLPATTLTMCPSCERVTSSSAPPPTPPSTAGETALALAPPPTTTNNNKSSSSSSSKLFPFLAAHAQPAPDHLHQTAS